MEIVWNDRDIDRTQALEYRPRRLWRSGPDSRRGFAQAGRQGRRLRYQAAQGSGRRSVALARRHAWGCSDDVACRSRRAIRLHRFRRHREPGRPGRGSLRADAWFLDFNSASPGAKQRAAALIDGKGGRYVEGAVMTSIPPYRIKVPLLLGGAGAEALAPLLVELGFDAKGPSKEPGGASPVKTAP